VKIILCDKFIESFFQIILILLIVLVVSGCKIQEVSGMWTNKQILIDGNSNEWKGFPWTFFPEQKISLSVCNDSDFVYFMFRTSDIKLVQTIKTTGITLFLNSDGKKKKDFFIRYKGGPSRKQLLAISRRLGNQSNERWMTGEKK